MMTHVFEHVISIRKQVSVRKFGFIIAHNKNWYSTDEFDHEFVEPWRVRAALILDVLTVAFSFYLWTIFIVGFLLIWNRIWIMIGWRWFWRWQRGWWKLRWWIWCRCLFWCYRWRIGWCYFRCLRLCCTMCAMSRNTWFNIWCYCSIWRCSSLQNTRCRCYWLARWWRSLCPRC